MMLTNMLQSLLNGLTSAANSAIRLLPISPFLRLNEIAIDNELLQFISWLVPFPQIIALLEAWVACIAIWYVVSTIIRWAKMIQ